MSGDGVDEDGGDGPSPPEGSTRVDMLDEEDAEGGGVGASGDMGVLGRVAPADEGAGNGRGPTLDSADRRRFMSS